MIFITGDTHGNHDWGKVFNFARSSYCKPGDTLIICGDFGAIWNGDQSQLNTYERLKDVTILFVDGNHENFDLLEEYPKEQRYGGTVQRIRSNVFHLMRGEYYTIEGKTFFVMGGATSIDKKDRLEAEREANAKLTAHGFKPREKHIFWWEQEQPTEEELKYAKDNLALYGNKVDYILTHTAGNRIMQEYLFYKKEDTPLNAFLDYIMENVEYKMWYCGHFHTDFFCGNVSLRILYEDVVQVGEAIDYRGDLSLHDRYKESAQEIFNQI